MILEDLERTVIERRPPDPSDSRPSRPPNFRPGNRPKKKAPPRDPIEAAKEIQALWRSSRPRAFAMITEDDPPHCLISDRTIHDHFLAVHAAPNHAPSPVPLPIPKRPTVSSPLSAPFTPSEVLARLRKATDTAPGADTIKYSEWKRLDPSAKILTRIFNCVKSVGVPSRWKESVTTLIYKGGPKTSMSSWRPIALLPTISKVYGNVISTRLTNWATSQGRISRAQKGFLPFRGCLEQNSLLQTCLQDARRRKKPLSCAFLDLRNAFGSVPHSTIRSSLLWLGLAPSDVDLLEASYLGSTTRIRTPSGTTAPVPILSGVVQGAPLSPIIFNLSLEPMIRAAMKADSGYSTQGHAVSVLAYADDLAVIAPSTVALQRQLDAISLMADWSGLVFNQKKCSTITLRGKENTRDTLTVQGVDIPSLADGEEYKHLGVPTGTNTFPSGTAAISKMKDHLKKIDDSLLCPWQKFDALRGFIVPQISFHLLHGSVPKAPLIELDKQIKRCAKRWLNVPQRASNEILYLGFDQGGQSLLPLSLLADVSTVSHAAALLHSKDASVADLSLRSAREVAGLRAKKKVTAAQLADYLSGQTDGIYRTPTSDVNSIWTSARAATRRLSATVPVGWYSNPRGGLFVSLNGSPLSPQSTQQRLTTAIRDSFLASLQKKRDQGSSYRTPGDPFLSNFFVRDGKFLRFTDWRFIHRGRLNLLPVNGARRFDPNCDKRCRRCGAPNETLNHVLSSCVPNLPEIRKRHDFLHARLRKALVDKPGVEIRHDRTVDGCNSLRPDIVRIDTVQKHVVITDIHCPFDNDTDCIERANETKRVKYEPVIRSYEEQGFSVEFRPLVVTALGRWWRGSCDALKSLKISPHYAELLRKLLVTDAIRGSRNVYVTHMTGVAQT